ncbi:MAG: MFS transporter [Bacteroidota bacterium]
MSSVSIKSEKPRLSFWQVWNMSFGFLGIQFGFALQNANTSRIFETLGADTKNLAFYWLAAPVTGLIVQPIIGYYSDKTWHPKWGRRRPYFAIGAILATIALCIMPNSPALWIAIGMLWIMDGSINISMEPFRAFVGDMLPEEQRTKGFAMQSFFIGIGAIVASYLPYVLSNWLGVPNTSPDGGIAPSVKWSFYLGAIAFFGAVMWTVFTTKEYPPAEEEIDGGEESKEPLVIRYSPNTYMQIGLALLAVGVLLAYWFYAYKLSAQLYVLSGMFSLFGLSYVGAASLMKKNRYRIGFVQIVRDFQNMPKTMVQLAFVQFFSWFALFSMWIYSTTGVTSHIYDMKLTKAEVNELTAIMDRNAGMLEATLLEDVKKEFESYQIKFQNGEEQVVTSIKVVNAFLQSKESIKQDSAISDKLEYISKEYNDGADWVGALFGNYNGFAAIAALFLPFLARITSRKVTHLIMLFSGGIGLLSFYFIKDPNYLIVSMIGVGFAWASILSIPYALLSGSIPQEKMGYYMGIFNFFIVIPQIVAASVLGFLVSTFLNGEFIFALVIGGCSMILAGLLVLMVHDTHEVAVKKELDT